jgi:hypothetical protein
VAALFLGCFAFGVILTIASFALGAFGGHLHLAGLDLGGGDAGGDVGAGGADQAGAHVSPFNLSTISAFLAWFGGAGYLLVRFSDLAAVLVLLVSGAVGVVGGGIIFVTLTRYVLPRLTELRPEDFRVEGAIGRVTVPIRAGGTGEVVYSLGGTRHVDGARSVSGEAVERGAEVVIQRMEKGIAYVERWDRLAAKLELPPGDGGPA